VAIATAQITSAKACSPPYGTKASIAASSVAGFVVGPALFSGSAVSIDPAAAYSSHR
jgi:hypothetical protein